MLIVKTGADLTATTTTLTHVAKDRRHCGTAYQCALDSLALDGLAHDSALDGLALDSLAHDCALDGFTLDCLAGDLAPHDLAPDCLAGNLAPYDLAPDCLAGDLALDAPYFRLRFSTNPASSCHDSLDL